MEQAFFNRYGFRYMKANNPPMVDKKGKPLFPAPSPLYTGASDEDAVKEHGEWCLARCIGKDAAGRLPIPASSISIYAANERRIISAME